MKGSPDEVIIQKARSDNLVILTFDKDYGELIFHSRVPNPLGVIFFRLTLPITLRKHPHKFYYHCLRIMWVLKNYLLW